MDIFLTILVFIGMVIFAALTTFVSIVNTMFICTPDWIDDYITPLTEIVIGIWIIIAILVGVSQLMSFPPL
jgi:SNF family Na+-dependent transporter